MFRKITAIISFSILISSFALAQENANEPEYAEGPFVQRPSYGLFFDLNYNMHSADFTGKEWDNMLGTDRQGFNCCPIFESGSGIGFAIGGFYALPVLESWDLNIRLAYSDISGKLSQEENIYVSGQEGYGVNGKFEYIIDASIRSAGIMPLMSYKATDEISIHLGFRAGVILTQSYEQKEEIIEPSFGNFPAPDADSRTRNNYSGDIVNGATIDAAGIVGISYSLPMGSSFEWFIEPELFYALGIMPLATDLSWTANTLSGGVSIRYAPRTIIEPIVAPADAPMPLLPPPPKPPKFDAFITAVSVDENGNESEVSKIRVEEYLSRRIHPLLNFIFFDDNNSDIPPRYTRMSEEDKAIFSTKYLENLKTMEVYYQVLNIVGNRMKRFPNTTLQLIGCNSSQGAEAGNKKLSRNRAQTVKDFITKEWDIDSDRITIVAKNLPDVPSNPKRIQGVEENRRVEMKSKFSSILFEPITVRDTIRETNPPMLRFKPSVQADAGIKTWKVITYQGDNLLKVFEGTGFPDPVLELNLQEEQEYVPLLKEPFRYKLIVIDNDNKTWESEVQSLKVEPYTIQNKFIAMMDGEEVDARDFDQFSLISFKFNQSSLTAEHKPIIKMAKQRILENSKVIIEGRTDNTGDPARNRKLSKERANVTADGLNVNRKIAKGLGSDKPFYTNELPEGRFYNRIVFIQIETKIKFE